MISTSTRRGTGVGAAMKVSLCSLQQGSEKGRRKSEKTCPCDAWANQSFTFQIVVFLWVHLRKARLVRPADATAAGTGGTRPVQPADGDLRSP